MTSIRGSLMPTVSRSSSRPALEASSGCLAASCPTTRSCSASRSQAAGGQACGYAQSRLAHSGWAAEPWLSKEVC